MQEESAFREGRRGRTGIARILSNPIARCTDALVSPGLVLADSDRKPAVSGAGNRITNEGPSAGIARRWNFVFGGNTIRSDCGRGLGFGYGSPPCLLQGHSPKVGPSFAHVAARFIR
jgi:hypothetical protein